MYVLFFFFFFFPASILSFPIYFIFVLFWCTLSLSCCWSILFFLFFILSTKTQFWTFLCISLNIVTSVKKSFFFSLLYKKTVYWMHWKRLFYYSMKNFSFHPTLLNLLTMQSFHSDIISLKTGWLFCLMEKAHLNVFR